MRTLDYSLSFSRVKSDHGIMSATLSLTLSVVVHLEELDIEREALELREADLEHKAESTRREHEMIAKEAQEALEAKRQAEEALQEQPCYTRPRPDGHADGLRHYA